MKKVATALLAALALTMGMLAVAPAAHAGAGSAGILAKFYDENGIQDPGHPLCGDTITINYGNLFEEDVEWLILIDSVESGTLLQPAWDGDPNFDIEAWRSQEGSVTVDLAGRGAPTSGSYELDFLHNGEAESAHTTSFVMYANCDEVPTSIEYNCETGAVDVVHRNDSPDAGQLVALHEWPVPYDLTAGTSYPQVSRVGLDPEPSLVGPGETLTESYAVGDGGHRLSLSVLYLHSQNALPSGWTSSTVELAVGSPCEPEGDFRDVFREQIRAEFLTAVDGQQTWREYFRTTRSLVREFIRDGGTWPEVRAVFAGLRDLL